MKINLMTVKIATRSTTKTDVLKIDWWTLWNLTSADTRNSRHCFRSKKHSVNATSGETG